MAEIALNNVTKRFADGTIAVKQADFTIGDGELFILVGPSGCGKSTLLNMIAGIEDVSEGEIRVDGKLVNDIDPKDRNMAMVFQSYAIYPHMTVRQNLAFPLTLAKLPKAEIAARVARAAAILELADLLDRKPASLSGGQRQRVAMGRAIVRQPVAFLLDEPLSNLDARLRVQMRTEIARLQRNLRTTTIYVTHDQTEAMTLGDRVAVLNKGEVQQIGTPRELYAEPRNLFVAGFVGSPAMNFLPAEIRDGRLFLPMAELPLPKRLRDRLPPGQRQVIAGVRPEHLEDAELVDTDKQRGAVFEVTVDVLEWLGADLYLYFQQDCAAERLRALPPGSVRATKETERISLVARVDPSSRAAENERLVLWLDGSRINLFDADTGANLCGALP
jgi:multiple sugar transport system ATP-binding protein